MGTLSTSCTSLLAAIVIAASSLGCGASGDAAGDDVASDDTNEVKQASGPLGTYAARDTAEGLRLEIRVVFRSDKRWFATVGVSCEGPCTPEQEAVKEIAFPPETSRGWGTFRVKRSGGKSFLHYTLDEDSPQMDGFTEEPDAFVLEGDTLTLTGSTGEVTKMTKEAEGVCREVADCARQGLSQGSCGSDTWECFEGVCAPEGPIAACEQ